MQRYSKKRQAVLDCLKSTGEHPTAERIYARLKPVYPDISLATVYRNLNQLEEAGLIASVGGVNGQKRYDANAAPHPHVVCLRCGRTVDLEKIPFPEETRSHVEQATGFCIESVSLRFNGLCKVCREKEKRQ